LVTNGTSEIAEIYEVVETERRNAPLFMNAQEARAYLGIAHNVKQITRWHAEGQLPGNKVGEGGVYKCAKLHLDIWLECNLDMELYRKVVRARIAALKQVYLPPDPSETRKLRLKDKPKTQQE
jgi:hypothetical protein